VLHETKKRITVFSSFVLFKSSLWVIGKNIHINAPMILFSLCCKTNNEKTSHFQSKLCLDFMYFVEKNVKLFNDFRSLTFFFLKLFFNKTESCLKIPLKNFPFILGHFLESFAEVTSLFCVLKSINI